MNESVKKAIQECLARFGVILEGFDCFFSSTSPQRLGELIDKSQTFSNNRKKNLIKLGNIVFDMRMLTLTRDGNVISLTEKEAAILQFLYDERRSVSRKTLLDRVWGYVDGVETHTLETHIYRLRQKLEIDSSDPEILLTDDDGYFLNV